ncbi:16S rRNA (adenine(1518)-N(6)/adenine(1519)-N(6)) -dimethyltransferase RsmA [Aurantivibrio infirmus]
MSFSSSASSPNPQHQAKKRFGQNFLVDTGIIDKIIKSIAAKSTQRIVEIGPGQGALTLPLLETCDHLDVVEVDRDLVARLSKLKEKYNNLHIHEGDALKFNFSQLVDKENSLRVVGNLPYNISTPLIFHLLEAAVQIEDMHFMLQKEVVDRIVARKGSKQYGRLSVIVQYYCKTDCLFLVPPECFSPRPKVQSAIVRLEPHRSLPFIANDIALLKQLVNRCFQQRRKTLRNSLRTLLPLEAVTTIGEQEGIDITLRPENLDVKDYVKLANLLDRDFRDQLFNLE